MDNVVDYFRSRVEGLELDGLLGSALMGLALAGDVVLTLFYWLALIITPLIGLPY